MQNNKTNPTVSIILPTFNRAALLPRAINSVLAQSFTDWELLIWDDGSTDNTGAVVQAYKDARIRYYSAGNHGAALARNRALEKCSADLIAFLDSDDEWLPQKLDTQLKIMQHHPEVQLLFTDFDNITEGRAKVRGIFDEYAPILKQLKTEQIDEHCYFIRDGFLKTIALENYIALDTVILRRDVLQSAGGFNEELSNCEDFELWWRLRLSGIGIAFIDQTTLIRHKPTGSLSSASVTNLQNRLKALDLCAAASRNSQAPASVEFLHPQYRNAWQLLMAWYAEQGDFPNMRHALIESLSYGIRPGTLRLLVQSLAVCAFRRQKQDAR